MKRFHLFVVLILSPVAGGWSRSQPSVGEPCVRPGCGVLIKGLEGHTSHLVLFLFCFVFLFTGKNDFFTYSQRYVKDNSHVMLLHDKDLLPEQLPGLCLPQICVGKLEDGEMFLKLSSGKKRGLVPAESIEEI